MGRHEDALARVAKSKNVQRGHTERKPDSELDKYKHNIASQAVKLLHNGTNAVVYHGTDAAAKLAKSKIPSSYHGVVDQVRGKVAHAARTKIDSDFANHQKAFA